MEFTEYAGIAHRFDFQFTAQYLQKPTKTEKIGRGFELR
jgi:hypothetical protein